MEKSEQKINEIKQKYKYQIDRLDKLILNLYAVSNIRYWYDVLSKIPIAQDYHYLMQIEAFTTSIIISYGRLFGETNGTIPLDKKIIPKEFVFIHDEIMNLRNERYAHHGKHATIQKDPNIQFVDSRFFISPEIQIDFCFGAPKHWASLFEWLDNYMHKTIHDLLTFLTNETKTEWIFPNGPKPSWIP